MEPTAETTLLPQAVSSLSAARIAIINHNIILVPVFTQRDHDIEVNPKVLIVLIRMCKIS